MINIFFTSNFATLGGAIYIDDETNFKTCTGEPDHKTNCFLQVLSPQRTNNVIYDIVSIEFTNNNGSTLYGGLLDRCTLSPFAEILILYKHVEYIKAPIYGVSYATSISNLNAVNVSSAPVQLCFCTEDYQPDCSYQPHPIQIKKGEKFTVSLVAVDQVNHSVANTTIYSSLLSHVGSGLGKGQMIQVTNDHCTELVFNVYSPNPYEELTLYAEGPCKNVGKSQSRISIIFLNCTCPVGFQPKDSEGNSNCECVCDSKLSPYIIDPNCNPTTRMLMRNGDFWLMYLNNSDSFSSYSYLIHPHCPFDYCHSSDSKIQINLNTADGADVQCTNNRSGLLCALCQPGQSPSIGSSRCIACPKMGYFIIFLIVLILVGLSLVVLLLVLNLTVAIGTINGVIFYANIVNANKLEHILPSFNDKVPLIIHIITRFGAGCQYLF